MSHEGVNALRIRRLDHAGVVVDELDAVTAFFLAVGSEREVVALIAGEAVREFEDTYRLCFVCGPESRKSPK